VTPTNRLILINATDGIGAGYSTHVPCYNSVKVKANVIRCLHKKPQMLPWYMRIIDGLQFGGNNKHVPFRVLLDLYKTDRLIAQLGVHPVCRTPQMMLSLFRVVT
jgi:DNA gyrase/topoisomerase IV subunit A